MRQPDDWCETDVQIIALTDTVNEQQREIDELKAMVNALKSELISVCDKAYDPDVYLSDEGLSEVTMFAKGVAGKAPKQCLLEHDKRVIKAHISTLVECITAVPVPEYGREYNEKMRNAIVNIMKGSVES